MNTTLEYRSDGGATLGISADWPEVAADYEDLMATYSTLPVPGFRAGKAPRSAIALRFRRQIRDAFTARCGRRLVREALRERGLGIAGPVSVTAVEVAPGHAFVATAHCIPVPEFDLPDYAHAPLTCTTDNERRDELSGWLLQQTAWDVPEPLTRQECARGGPAEPGTADWHAAAQRVKLLQILDQIGDAEGIEVDARDVDTRIARMAAACGSPAASLRRQLGDDGVCRLQAMLRAEQTLAHLLALAAVHTGTGRS